MAGLLALWGAYWALSPGLFIHLNGMAAVSKAWLGLGLIVLRGVVFLWLAYTLAKRRFSDVPMILIILTPLCLSELINAIRLHAAAADEIGLLILSVIQLGVAVGLCALVWRLDRRRPTA